MDPTYAAAYQRLYENHWWWRAREAFLVRVLRDTLGPDSEQSRSILDVGCGNGLFFDKLTEFGNVWGVEMDSGVVSRTGPHHSRIHIGPFDHSFEPGRRFDLILMLDVLEHLAKPGEALGRARPLLKDCGRVLLTVPAFKALWTRHDDLNQHRTRYTKSSLRKDVGGTGLTLEFMLYFFHWTVPIKLLIRAAEALTSRPATVAQVPGPVVNRTAQLLSRFEQQFVTPLRLPFGSSLLAVLRPNT